MKLFSSKTKMADIIHSNYLLLPVISRFGIAPGFGEEIVSTICKKRGIDVEFFLAIINAFTNEEYFPRQKLRTFNVLTIVEYLEKTHIYYTRTQIPLIETLLTRMFKHHEIDSKSVELIRKFFLDYKKELLDHLSREDKKTFPYVKKIYRISRSGDSDRKRKASLPRYSMQMYEREHNDVDEKLFDLKNILIKYVHGTISGDIFNNVIFELFRLEKDILDHTRIENKILLPMVTEMENSLYLNNKIAPERKIYTENRHETRKTDPVPAAADNIRINTQSIRSLFNRDGLSRRELEVLQLVACGYINKQIADSLTISLHTVISHRKNISSKLQIKTVAGLTVYALLNGLISLKK
jgi:regulator of cell morphogenesis and NO signaling